MPARVGHLIASGCGIGASVGVAIDISCTPRDKALH
jgi:hypothetical protein